MSDSDEVNGKNYKSTKIIIFVKKRRCEATKIYRENKKTFKIIQNHGFIEKLHEDPNCFENLNKSRSTLSPNSSKEAYSSSETDSTNTSFPKSSSDDTDNTDLSSDDNNNQSELFLNSSTKVNDLNYSLLNFILKHKMSDKAVKDYLTIMKTTIPAPYKCPRTIKAIYDSILKEREDYINRTYFCKTCAEYAQKIKIAVYVILKVFIL